MPQSGLRIGRITAANSTVTSPWERFCSQGDLVYILVVCYFSVSLHLRNNISIFADMTFKGSLYITDPCYFTRMWDFDDEVIDAPEFTDYLISFTGTGDGSWRVFKLPEDFPADYEKISAIIEDVLAGKKNFYKIIGRYSVDSATACAVYKDEVDAHNPRFKEEFAKKTDCWALIEDFDGEVRPYSDTEGTLHFIGMGNICFFTA